MSLTPDVLDVIRHQHTETPGTGRYDHFFLSGSYLCRACGIALFRSDKKFNSGCGWPSFDDCLSTHVLEKNDADGLRIEIVCARCNAHLGHVFKNEGFTSKNLRYCVNSKSLDFVENKTVTDTEEIIVAGGCFWGVEYYLQKLKGVIKTEVGYIGGIKSYPFYQEVCEGKTGHYEAVRVLFSPSILQLESLLKYFFEIHDPSQCDGQGPDIGSQYKSALFYYTEAQKKIAETLINDLKQKINVSTRLLPISTFWPAEDFHQQYYEKMNQKPYCHTYVQRF